MLFSKTFNHQTTRSQFCNILNLFGTTMIIFYQLWIEKTIAVTICCVVYCTCIRLSIPKWEFNFVLATDIKSVHSVSTPVCLKLTSSTYMKCWRCLKILSYTIKPGCHALLCFRLLSTVVMTYQYYSKSYYQYNKPWKLEDIG